MAVGPQWKWSCDHHVTYCAADVNMCESDLHRCPEHSFCIHNGTLTVTAFVYLLLLLLLLLLLSLLSLLSGPAAYHCQCEEGRATKKCVLLYVGAVMKCHRVCA